MRVAGRGIRVVFDFFGVISSEVAPIWLAEHLGAEAAQRVKASVVHAADSGEISSQEMFEVLGAMTHMPWRQVESQWEAAVVIDRGVVELIRELRANRSVAILSNAPAPFMRGIIARERLESLFDVVVVSSEEGCAKPDPKIYAVILERLGVGGNSAVLIDDNAANVKGAILAGMRGLLFESVEPLRTAFVELGLLAAG